MGAMCVGGGEGGGEIRVFESSSDTFTESGRELLG